MTSPIFSLDRTDIKILDILQRDGKISNIKLAEEVNLSATAALAGAKINQGRLYSEL
jgi:Lrp/AsnC family leucine-responsive transcriptional regulator